MTTFAIRTLLPTFRDCCLILDHYYLLTTATAAFLPFDSITEPQILFWFYQGIASSSITCQASNSLTGQGQSSRPAFLGAITLPLLSTPHQPLASHVHHCLSSLLCYLVVAYRHRDVQGGSASCLQLLCTSVQRTATVHPHLTSRTAGRSLKLTTTTSVSRSL